MRPVRSAGLCVSVLLACPPPESGTSGSEATGGASTSTGGASTDSSTSGSGSTSTGETTGSSTSAASSTTTGAASTGAETTTGAGGCGDGIAEEGELCFDFVETETLVVNSVALADFNEDGHLDLVGAIDGLCPGPPAPGPAIREFTAAPPQGPLRLRCPALLRTIEGDGLGSFTPHVYDEEALEATAGRTLAVADVDGDGHVDLITSTHTPALLVLPGVGDGTFEASVSHPSPVVFSDLVAGDVDGDGDVDVVGVGQAGIVAFLGDGAGDLAASPVFGVDDGPERREIALFDLDVDGALDLVINRADFASSEIERWFGVGDGSFVETTPTAVEPRMFRLMAARSPSEPAYLLVTAYDSEPGQWSLRGFEVDEDGGLGPLAVIVADTSAADVALGRFDGGLGWDAVLLGASEVRAILDVNLESPPPVEVVAGDFWIPHDRAPVGDFNEDGVDDVVLDNGVLLSNP